MHGAMLPRNLLSSCLDRRQFLKRCGQVLGASAWAGHTPFAAETPRPKRLVGSNIYGWSQYYQREGKNVQEHLGEVMSALRDAGYDYLEGSVDVQHPEAAVKQADAMRSKGLQPVCLYTGALLHDGGQADQTVEKLLRAAETCRQAGFTIIDCNPDPIGREKTDEELNVQNKALIQLGAGLARLGMKLGVHNHTPEMLNHAREFHHIFDQTDPRYVGLCYDVHWVFRGGVSPADCLRQYGSRVVSWHLRQSREGIWWEDLDTGDIAYDLVAQFSRDHAVAAPLTVELALERGTKITRSVVENHQRSREFVRRVFGV